MKRSRAGLYLLLTILGAASLYAGGFVLTDEKYKQISGLCIGLGAAVFYLALGNMIGAFVVSKTENDEIRRRKAIEVHDERNVRLKEKVGAAVNRVMVYLLSIVVLSLGFMGANPAAIILVAGVMLAQLVLTVVFFNYYGKRM